MSKQEIMKMQTCVLKVNIQCHCEGCYTKIKKLLQKVEGVYNATINPEQGKVTVTGNVDPAKLIKKLEKSGKHAELWGGPKGFNNAHQFMNMQLNNAKGGGGHGGGGKDNKSQKGGKDGQQQQIQQLMQQVKGSKDLKLPQKDQKSVKFNMQDDYIDDSEDEFDDEFDDDEFDDDDEDDFSDDEEFGHSHGHGKNQGKGQFGGHQIMPNKMMPMAMMGNDHAPNGLNGGQPKGGGGGGGKANKGGGNFEIPVVMKGKEGGKNGKKDGNGKNGKSKGGSEKKEGKDKDKSKSKSKDNKSGVKSGIGAFLSFGRKSKNGREKDDNEFSTDITNHGGKAGNNNGHGAKKGSTGKNEGAHLLDSNKIKQIKGGFGGGGDGHGHGGGKSMGHMGGQMGGQMPQMGGFPAVQGMPMNGQYQGIMGGGGGGNPYSQQQLQQLQQQQYMAMMMNQQRQNGNDMFQPMMYARPSPAVNYMPPPPMPSHPMADPYTHIFSDENAESCTIM